uniref:RING-type E3 ubiquitin transferase n=1 Tax=Cyclopterus lumpus TaxID=8103 RepID=A0A8C3B5Y5_CYCLU
DIIILRRKVDDNWYHGELNGCHGFLPASYIQLLRPLSQTPPQGKALYDFEVKDKDQDKDCLADELELRKGEMYRVTEKCQDGWFKGTSLRTAACGVFPGNYVTPVSRSVSSGLEHPSIQIKAAPPPPAAPANRVALSPWCLQDPHPSPLPPQGPSSPSHPLSLASHLQTYRVVVPYPPQSEAEIELREGDVVFVHKKRDDGWYKGTLQRTGQTGLFPSSFVESF